MQSCWLEKHQSCCSRQPCDKICVKLLMVLHDNLQAGGGAVLTSDTSYVSPEAREATLSPVCRLPSTTSTRQITPLHRDSRGYCSGQCAVLQIAVEPGRLMWVMTSSWQAVALGMCYTQPRAAALTVCKPVPGRG